ncbi:MAG: hypothetical protein DRP76_04455 [Candidatus Omnitrophota bacterium]|nr:MAG: hypothetical protein DRP76_04455 [Candidatus Omnitrophota bacterium]
MRHREIILIFAFFSFILGKTEGFDYPYRSFYNRDPLKPLVNKEGRIVITDKRRGFLLQGIIYTDSYQAVINNNLYRENDVIQGYRIKKIEKDKVVLEKGGEKFILKWEEK